MYTWVYYLESIKDTSESIIYRHVVYVIKRIALKFLHQNLSSCKFRKNVLQCWYKDLYHDSLLQ